MSLHEARMKSLRDEHEEKDKLEASVVEVKKLGSVLKKAIKRIRKPKAAH